MDVVAATVLGFLGRLFGLVDVVALTRFLWLFGVFRLLGLLGVFGILGIFLLRRAVALLFVVLDLFVHKLDEGVALSRVVVEDVQRVDDLDEPEVNDV